jgi:hypothetical protein
MEISLGAFPSAPRAFGRFGRKSLPGGRPLRGTSGRICHTRHILLASLRTLGFKSHRLQFLKNKTLSVFTESVLIFKWCPRGDLNPHTFRHTHLKRTCLPIPPPGQGILFFSEVFLMVHPVGLEPTTNGFEDRYSIQLSYGCRLFFLESVASIAKASVL